MQNGETTTAQLQGEGRAEIAVLKAQLATFEELLAVHEATAADQIRKREAVASELAELLRRERERNEALERLQLTVQQLSTPALEVWDGVLVLPVIGAVDEVRSAEMLERLLADIQRGRYEYVIIDVTGLGVVDTSIADTFVRMARAATLLGARCVLTGIGPSVAQTLVGMGVDLGAIQTLATLKHGLQACLRAREDRRGRR